MRTGGRPQAVCGLSLPNARLRAGAQTSVRSVLDPPAGSGDAQSRVRLVALAACLAVVALNGSLPAFAEPPVERFLVGHRFKITDEARWQGLRVSFFAPTESPTEPVRLAVHLFPSAESVDCAAGLQPAELLQLAEKEIDLTDHPVVGRGSLWIEMPPKDEVWLYWPFDEPLALEPGWVLVTIDADAGDAVRGRALIDLHYVLSPDKASLLSRDGGASFMCLDEASALAALGLVHEGETTSLLAVEVVAVADPAF